MRKFNGLRRVKININSPVARLSKEHAYVVIAVIEILINAVRCDAQLRPLFMNGFFAPRIDGDWREPEREQLAGSFSRRAHCRRTEKLRPAWALGKGAGSRIWVGAGVVNFALPERPRVRTHTAGTGPARGGPALFRFMGQAPLPCSRNH